MIFDAEKQMSYCGKLIRGKKTSNVMINIRMNVRDSVWDIIIL